MTSPEEPREHVPAGSGPPRKRVRWAVASALATILLAGAGATVVVARLRDGPAGVAGDAQAGGSVAGDCNANGVNNVIHCEARAPKIANVEVREGSPWYLWFDGPPDRLPAPPERTVGEMSCYDAGFMAWVRSIDRFHLTDISKTVVLSAGTPDLVTLTRATVSLGTRKAVPPGSGTWVKCVFGGDGFFYHHDITIDSQQQTTTVVETTGDDSEIDSGPAEAMPPASVALADKSQDLVAIHVKSKPDHAYTGFVTITASVNGETRTLSLGGPQSPLRWVAMEPAEGADWYAPDDAGKWHKNWSPLCGSFCSGF
ncbi:hypothetical protein GCM10010168_52460 [Actinoplanes ianthinogenes]|uniref:Uncharacterized protein n=1 Tax=Actinoplanes ianthinogenes TaxID=122358 RepID=A0ABM7M3T2_9ACTN|nr:hypothetical protein [Actinoplanes ianthinogenes]BCJ46295.1 hypothetical protein Aiant_69520 [Actinoplanes ianthinogenes]GGR27655.1 hypothetical protein GCM10010168_52460 [Actinoplanes ianthinogenes]